MASIWKWHLIRYVQHAVERGFGWFETQCLLIWSLVRDWFLKYSAIVSPKTHCLGWIVKRRCGQSLRLYLLSKVRSGVTGGYKSRSSHLYRFPNPKSPRLTGRAACFHMSALKLTLDKSMTALRDVSSMSCKGSIFWKKAMRVICTVV